MRARPAGSRLVLSASVTRNSKGERDDRGNDDRRGPKPVRGDLLDEGRREAQAARVERLDRLPRSERGRPGLGGLRLGPGGLGELRLRPRGAADHAGGRAQEQAAGAGARRPLRRLAGATRDRRKSCRGTLRSSAAATRRSTGTTWTR